MRLDQKTLFMFFGGFFCLVMQLAPLGALQAREEVSPQTRQITDQLNRTVTIPDQVQRSVVLMHHALDIAIQLGAQDRIVGVLQKWPEMLPDAVKAMPRLRDMPMPGELSSVNMESLLQLRPDVVIVTHYAPEAMRRQIEAAGIPVLAISMYAADYEQASRLNPALKDPDEAYTKGMDAAIRILGEVYGKEQRAAELMATIRRNRALLAEYLGKVDDRQRVRCYMANPDLHTYGSGKYTGVIMSRAGCSNVAAALEGYKQVNMEDILRWDPQVILVQDRYRQVADEIRGSASWSNVAAVRDKRIYVTPEFVKPWGHPTPESMALGELWMARTFYPDAFAGLDLERLVNSYYQTFYGIEYSGAY